MAVNVNLNGKKPLDGWPEPAAEEAFYGLAGDFVERVGPESEADRHALLAHYLAAAGNLFGSNVYYQVEGDRHPARLFVAVVGATSKARKGTAWSRVRQVSRPVDHDWADRVTGGLSSGEGPLWAVRDQIVKTVRDKENDAFVEEVSDPGIEDKRLLVIEAELSRHFDVIARSGNTLSETLRRLWDGGVVSSLTKNSPVKATNPHVSLIGHISREEMKRKATDVEAANGFLNRFVFIAARRSQHLPFGGDLDHDDLTIMQHELAKVVLSVRARGEQQITWSDEARERWIAAYEELSSERGGLVGAVTARAEAQVVRLSVCYALLSDADEIELPHLEAALALWDYSARSAEWVFGDSTGHPIADLVLSALRGRGEVGMTRTEIRDLTSRNHSEEIPKALALLIILDQARFEIQETGGRPAERWWAR